MVKSSLSLHDAIARWSEVWFDREFSQERKITVEWAVKGYSGECPGMVFRVMDGGDSRANWMTEVQRATGWTWQKTDDVAQFAYLEAYMWAKTGADALFRRVLENH